ncbi:MAG TPA: hypothetical protein VFN69_04515 [Rudaea sp.]|nr:hypothetical protein [Rudaea sp.]
MNATRKPLHHDITLPEQEAYAGYDYWRPSDASVQAAVCALIDAHADEFQELLDAAEFDAREQAAIDATEYMMEDR